MPQLAVLQNLSNTLSIDDAGCVGAGCKPSFENESKPTNVNGCVGDECN